VVITTGFSHVPLEAWSTAITPFFEGIVMFSVNFKCFISLLANVTNNSNVFAPGLYIDSVANVLGILW
jgi:hypothetical protein